MGHARRFLNLIVNSFKPGVLSLRCMDLERLQLFHPTTTPLKTHPDAESAAVPAVSDVGSHQKKNKQAAGAASAMKSIRLPNPSFSFQACSPLREVSEWAVDCFPLAQRKVICIDRCGRSVLFDGDTRDAVIMPELHRPKNSPISLFIPSDGGDGSLFIMETVPDPVIISCGIEQPSHDFEVLVCHKGRMTCQTLPPPPYVYELSYQNTGSKHEISSYAVVGAGSLICISVNGKGTYVLDIARRTWSKAGDWMLPFHGKVEYVPELNLWFGLSADDHHLAAADLSTMDTQPQLVGCCKELHPPEEWTVRRDAQVVYLGSGKFCIARFFFDWVSGSFGPNSYCRHVTAMTGVEVEVVPGANGNGGNGEVELETILHETRYHIPGNKTAIEELF